MKKAAILLILAVCVSAPLPAGTVIPGRWEKVENLKRGSDIRVHLDSGESLEGEFQGLQDDALALRLADDDLRQVPRSAVNLIEKPFRRADTVWDGTAIGAAIGGGWGAIVAAQEDIGSGVVATGLLFGAGIGALIDGACVRGQTGYEVIYNR